MSRAGSASTQEAFHVDRQGSLSADLELAPMPVDALRGIRFYGSQEDAAFVADELFPDGAIALGFGASSLLRVPVTGRKDSDAAVDLVFELIRRLEFPERRSRYSAIFAVPTVEEAQRFRAAHCRGEGRIWRVEGSEGFVADQRLLGIGGTAVDVWRRARRYWNGELGDDPLREILFASMRAIEPID